MCIDESRLIIRKYTKEEKNMISSWKKNNKVTKCKTRYTPEKHSTGLKMFDKSGG